jgi:uncharacterized membrane protein HdeD (DUF308 family)
MRRQMGLWWLIAFEGVAGIILGVLTFQSPDIGGQVPLTFIAAWSIITGAIEIARAVRRRASELKVDER